MGESDGFFITFIQNFRILSINMDSLLDVDHHDDQGGQEGDRENDEAEADVDTDKNTTRDRTRDHRQAYHTRDRTKHFRDTHLVIESQIRRDREDDLEDSVTRADKHLGDEDDGSVQEDH